MSDRNNIAPIPSRPAPGSPAWRRACGLLTISDHVRQYGAVRHPRGNYPTPMQDDLIETVTSRTVR